MMLTKNYVATPFSVHFSPPQNIVGRLTCLLRSRCSVAIACLLFSQAAFASKKQVFTSEKGNKVEVEAIENEAKIYEEAGVLYLVPGQSYKFKQTAIPARDWSVVGKKTMLTDVIKVPATKPPNTVDLTNMKFKAIENDDNIMPQIKVACPVLDTLTVETTFPAGITHDPNDKLGELMSKSMWILGGGSKPHTGRVKVIPSAARKEFKIRLHQWVNANAETNAEDPEIQKKFKAFLHNGEDESYSSYNIGEHNEIGNINSGLLETVSADFPGITGNRIFWEEVMFTKKYTASYSFNANLYLQYSVEGKDLWNTVGKVEWSVSVKFDPTGKAKFTESADGVIVPIRGDVQPGKISQESPIAPPAKKK